MRISYITDHRKKWRVKVMCRVLDVSESGYYKHLRKQPSRCDAELLAQIYKLLKEDAENANYGAKRIFRALKNNYSYRGGYHRIRRICRENHLIMRTKRHPNGITRADSDAQKSENLIKQDFSASKPNKKWLTDITEIACKDGKLYLAAILDCFDGSILGFQMDRHMRAELCVAAFENACRKAGARGMLLHSDRGSQFTSSIFRAALRRRRAVQSMSGVGRCYDNARMESFFATLKKEKIYQIDTMKMSCSQVKSVVFQFIAYYNLRRVYSPNAGWPPMVFRQMSFADAA